MAGREYRFYVYIMGSLSGTLYIGMTNNLHKRVWQHKQHEIEGFSQRYEVDCLLCWESFDDVRVAINREKRPKGWTRRKKITLIEKLNPSWCDLAKEWYQQPAEFRGPSLALPLAAPSVALAQDDTSGKKA